MSKTELKIIRPKRGQKKLTLGHLRQAIAGLPDSMVFGPTWEDDAIPDYYPVIGFRGLGIESDDTGSRFVITIRGTPLNDEG